MGQTFRVSLPGYDAETDTNPDHFALYADEDWVLIKEKGRGVKTVPSGPTVLIPHNSGYVPLVLAWALIGGNRIFLSGGTLTGTYNITMYVTENNIGIINSTGSTAVINYFVFYDKQGPGGNPSVPLPEQVVALTKQGYDVTTETNPNNFIFRSDLNTFKILYTDIASFSIPASTTATKAVPQKVWFNKIPAVTAFARKKGSSYVIGPSQFTNSEFSPAADNYKFFSVWSDNNNIFFNVRNDDASNPAIITFRYYLFEV